MFCVYFRQRVTENSPIQYQHYTHTPLLTVVSSIYPMMILWKKTSIKQSENKLHQKLRTYLCVSLGIKLTIKETHFKFDSLASEHKAKIDSVYLKCLARGTWYAQLKNRHYWVNAHFFRGILCITTLKKTRKTILFLLTLELKRKINSWIEMDECKCIYRQYLTPCTNINSFL